MIVCNSCRCSKCKKLLSYEERIKITVYEFVSDNQCNGSRNKTIDGFSLCRKCYKKYNEYTTIFLTKFTQFR